MQLFSSYSTYHAHPLVLRGDRMGDTIEVRFSDAEHPTSGVVLYLSEEQARELVAVLTEQLSTPKDSQAPDPVMTAQEPARLTAV